MYQFLESHPVFKVSSDDCLLAILDDCHLLKPMSPIEGLDSFDFDLVISVIFSCSFHHNSVLNNVQNIGERSGSVTTR